MGNDLDSGQQQNQGAPNAIQTGEIQCIKYVIHKTRSMTVIKDNWDSFPRHEAVGQLQYCAAQGLYKILSSGLTYVGDPTVVCQCKRSGDVQFDQVFCSVENTLIMITINSICV